MYWVNTMVRKLELYRTNAKTQGLAPAHFALIIIIVVHVVKHQSVINKYNERAESGIIDYSYNYSIEFIALQYKLILQLIIV